MGLLLISPGSTCSLPHLSLQELWWWLQLRQESLGAVGHPQVPWETPLRPHGLFPALCRKYETSRWCFSPSGQSPLRFETKGRRSLFQNKKKEKRSRNKVLRAIGCHGCKSFHGLINQLAKFVEHKSCQENRLTKLILIPTFKARYLNRQ